MGVVGQEAVRDSSRQQRGGSSGMHPERRVPLDSVRFDKLTAHPLSTKVYGDPVVTPELLKSIEDQGLLQPLLVRDNGNGASFTILGGRTRVAAWETLHEQNKIKSIWIPAKIFTVSDLEAEKLVLESNFQREKTAEQKIREYKELKRIEAALAKECQRGKAPARGDARDLAAKRMGMGSQKFERGEKIVDAADAGDPLAQDVLARVNAKTMSINKAHQVIQAKDPQRIAEGRNVARELSQLFDNGEVVRSKENGYFHLTLRNLTQDQIRSYAKVKP